MSHNLSVIGDTVEVFTAGKPAWHNLGANVEKAQTWQEAYKLAHLNWTVEKEQLKLSTGTLIPSYALVRSDTHQWLNTVGKGYRTVQNEELFTFVDTLIETKAAHYVSAGAIDGGGTVWCLAGLKKPLEPIPGDLYNTYLLFVDYRGTRAAKIKIVTTRVVCQNTLSAALGERGVELNLRHTTNIDTKMEYAKTLIAATDDKVKALETKLKALVNYKITKESFKGIMDKLFPALETSGRQANEAAIIASNFMSNDGGAFRKAEYSAYAMLQACTRYIDHQKGGYRIVGDRTPEALTTVRSEAALFGRGEQWKTEALNTICEAVGLSAPEEKVDAILSQVQYN